MKTAEAVSQINGTSGDNVAQRGTVWQISCAPGGVGECWWGGKHSTSGHSKSPHCFVFVICGATGFEQVAWFPTNLCHCPTRCPLYPCYLLIEGFSARADQTSVKLECVGSSFVVAVMEVSSKKFSTKASCNGHNMLGGCCV